MTASASTEMTGAMRAALDFLLNAQGEGGDWKDFLLPAGNSNVWVTGFVAGVLAELPEKSARDAAMAGWRFLEKSAKTDGGWSYNPSVPGDADSTLWALRLGEALGVEGSDAYAKAASFLESHMTENGGLATYAAPERVRRYIGLPPSVSFDGWTRSHVCVTAACANLRTHRQRLTQYLLQQQTGEGKWIAYWWFDDEFSTAEAVAALVGKGSGAMMAESAREAAASVERAARWALERSRILMGVDGSNSPHAFALAHVLRVLARAEQTPEVREAVFKASARLAEWQKADGSWPASARLRVPRPDAVKPSAETEWKMWAGMPQVAPTVENILKHTFSIYSPDHYGVYTTATVLRALHETGLAAS